MRMDVPRNQDVRVGYYRTIEVADVLRDVALKVDEGMIFHALFTDGDRITVYYEEDM